MSSWSVEEKKLSPDGWKRLDAANANIPAGSAYISPAIEALYFDMGSLSLVWDSVDGTGVITIECSVDGTYYCAVASMVIDATGTDHTVLGFPDFEFRFFRINYIPGASTTGTLNARYLLKSRI